MKKLKFLLLIFLCIFVFNMKVEALENGVYTIHNSINENYVLDITGGIVYNSNNLQIYQNNNSNAQKFKITNLNDGYVKISSVINDYYSFDVTGSYYNNGTNIQIYQSNGFDSQEWLIKESQDGFYFIISANNSYCLDIENGNIINQSNVQLFNCNNTGAQKFSFKKVFYPTKTVEDGIYTISSSLDSNKYIGIKNSIIGNWSNVELRDDILDSNKWVINYLGNGYYSIKSYLDVNYSLDVAGASIYNATNVQLYNYYGSNAQQWIVYDVGNGYYNIISKCNNLLIDLVGGNPIEGNNIQMYTYNGSEAQLFKLNKVIETGQKSIDDGTYFISPKSNYNKLVDITGGSIISGGNVQIYQGNFGVAQKWYIKYLNDGYYSILTDINRDYALEIDSNNNVIINKHSNKNNQKWIIRKANGSYYFISATGLYLDLFGGYTHDTNNVQVYQFNGSNAQKFDIRKTVSGISQKNIDNGIYRIVSALDKNMVIDLTGGVTNNGSNIQLYQSNGTQAQKWRVEYLTNGYYKISSIIDLTKTVDVANGGSISGSNVQIYDNNNSSGQQWIIKDAGEGYYNIVSNCSGLYLEVAGAGIFNGSNIQMYEGNSTNAQKFKFIKSEEKTRVIDVSYHQGTIDWNKVYNSGIYGVILRIGYWNTEDPKFAEYINEVKRLGIPYGIYIFSYANTTNGAGVEANFTNNIISKYNLNPTLGIYYDLEDWYLSADNTSNTLSKEQYDDIARTYINTVSQYVGSKYKVKIYADLNHVNNRFGDYARSESDWIAHYGVSSCGYKGPHSLWQYTSEATLDGIRGYVDMNYLY